MAFVLATPQALTNAASNVADIGSSLNAATTSAAEQTSSLPAAAADEVSAAVAALFSSHGQEFQKLSAEAANFHDKFTQALASGADAYSTAEANIAKTLTGGAGSIAPAAAAGPAAPYYGYPYGYGYGGYGFGFSGFPLVDFIFSTFYLLIACISNPYYAPIYILDYFSYLPYIFGGGYYY